MTARLALGAVLLAAGVAWLLSAAGVLELSYGTWIGVILVVLGAVIALVPGHHGLLVLVGVVVAIAGLPALLVDDDLLSGGIGDEREAPVSTTDLGPFRQGIGKLTVDLTAPVLELDGRSVEASVGIGELVVLVPRDADVDVDAHVGMGNVEAAGRTESGVDVDLRTTLVGTGDVELALELDVGIGNLQVRRR